MDDLSSISISIPLYFTIWNETSLNLKVSCIYSCLTFNWVDQYDKYEEYHILNMTSKVSLESRLI